MLKTKIVIILACAFMINNVKSMEQENTIDLYNPHSLRDTPQELFNEIFISITEVTKQNRKSLEGVKGVSKGVKKSIEIYLEYINNAAIMKSIMSKTSNPEKGIYSVADEIIESSNKYLEALTKKIDYIDLRNSTYLLPTIAHFKAAFELVDDNGKEFEWLLDTSTVAIDSLLFQEIYTMVSYSQSPSQQKCNVYTGTYFKQQIMATGQPEEEVIKRAQQLYKNITSAKSSDVQKELDLLIIDVILPIMPKITKTITQSTNINVESICTILENHISPFLAQYPHLSIDILHGTFTELAQRLYYVATLK